jgi:hypothetical protein
VRFHFITVPVPDLVPVPGMVQGSGTVINYASGTIKVHN